MIGFEVSHNGQRFCTAAVGVHGVLTAIVTWSSRSPESLAKYPPEDHEAASHEELRISVGGLAGETHHHWPAPTLQLGDEILVRICEIQIADAPSSTSQTTDDEQMLDYVRRMCQQWGWQFTES
jgi:hypothetical protein